MPTTTFPSGATASTVAPPPVEFDAITADDRTRQSFLLPQRSTLSAEATASFERAFGRPTRFIEPTFKRNPHRRHEPVRSRRTTAGNDVSTNWSGAVVDAPAGTKFTTATGQWNVPTANPLGAGSSYSSIWVGIDGSHGSTDVFQAGVECDSISLLGVTQATISPWWEWYPEYEIQITNLPVATGDELYCLLTVTAPTAGTIVLKNITQGLAVTFQVTAPTGTTLSGNCSEWIVEAPGIDGALSTLTNYGTVTFVDCSSTVNNGSIIQSGSGRLLDMSRSGQVLSKATNQGLGGIVCSYTGPKV